MTLNFHETTAERVRAGIKRAAPAFPNETGINFRVSARAAPSIRGIESRDSLAQYADASSEYETTEPAKRSIGQKRIRRASTGIYATVVQVVLCELIAACA